jgi:hypothetical protein
MADWWQAIGKAYARCGNCWPACCVAHRVRTDRCDWHAACCESGVLPEIAMNTGTTRHVVVGMLLAVAASVAAQEGEGGLRSPMDLFHRLDQDNDQYLSDAEAGADAAVLASFNALDTNDDRRISSAEYAAAVAPSARPPVRGMPPFDRLDTDGNGSLTSSELATGTAGGAGLLDELDVDRDGRVSPQEYLRPQPAPPAAAPATTGEGQPTPPAPE